MINSIIIDDEERARNGLRKMVETYCSGIQVVGLADNVKNGLEAIRQHRPDLVFLDIDMPDGDGFELLEQIDNINFDVVFATAYDHFAVKAFRFSAVDYLVKPIDLDELIDAVEKVKSKKNKKEKQEQYSVLQAGLRSNSFSKMAVSGGEGIIFVEIGDIIRMHSDGNYTTLYMLNGEKHTATRLLGDYEDLLNEDGFFRVHHSHLINMNHIKKYVRGRGGYVVMEDGSSVDVSVRRKDDFLQMMKGL